ncbi:MAG: hypothetical protein F2934_10505 [Actinobacteria bacterium]|nr:hypothetical protein [Actinomycetota bacterium]MTB07546.1 hypothetical protein [Actinomycetota bacterium]
MKRRSTPSMGRRRSIWGIGTVVGILVGGLGGAVLGGQSAGAVSPSSTPSWARQFGTSESDSAIDVAVARNGTVYSVGYTAGSLSGTGAGNADVWVSRHNPSGSRRWTKQFGTPGIEYVYGVAVSARNEIYVVGGSEGSLVGTNVNTAFTDAFIAKFDSNGRRKWIRQIASSNGGDDEARSVAVNSAGEVYVGGTTTGDLTGPGANQGNTDLWVARFDRNGNRSWLAQYGTDQIDMVHNLAVSPAGAIHLVGETEGSLPGTAANQGGFDFFVVSYDRSGNRQTNLQWGTPEADSLSGVAVGTGGELYVTGWTEGTLPEAVSAGGRDGVLARIDLTPSPSFTWEHQIGSDLSDEWSDVVVRGTNVFVTGSTVGSLAEPSAGGYDIINARYSTTGQRKWIDQVGSTQFDDSNAIAVSSRGDLYLAAQTEGVLGTATSGNADAVVLKYTASRNAMWVSQLGNSGNEYFYGIAAASNGTTWSVGAIGGPGWGGADGDVDVLAAKHDSAGNDPLVVRFGTTESDYANGAAAGPAGSVVIVGSTQGDLAETNGGSSLGDTDGFVTMLDSSGAVVWTRQIGSIYSDSLNAVAVSSRGDIYVTGTVGGAVEGLAWSGDSDVIVAKYNRYGTRKWIRQAGTAEADYANGIGVARNGSVYVAGGTEGSFSSTPATGTRLPMLLRYDSNGNRKWGRQYSAGSGAGDFSSIAVTPGGDVYAGGTTSGSVQAGVANQGIRDLFVVRVDRNGNMRWARQYGTAGSDRVYGVAVRPNGTVTVVGTTEGALGTSETFLGANPAAGDDDIVLMRFDRNGRRTVLRQWGTSEFDEATAVAVVPNGTVYVGGSTAGALGELNAGDMDAVTIRFPA